MALYTPFVERNIDKLAAGDQARQTRDLAQSAYMGDSQAMGELYGVNPQMAEKIKQSKAMELQRQQQATAFGQKQADRLTKQSDRKNKIAKQIGEEVAHMDFDSAVSYAAQQAQVYGIELPPLTKEAHGQFKQVGAANKSAKVQERAALLEQLPINEDGKFKPKFKKDGSKNWSAAEEIAMIDAGKEARAVGSADLTTYIQGLVEEMAETKRLLAKGAATGKLEAELTFKPRIVEAVELARAEAKEQGEKLTDLKRMKAAKPGLDIAVSRLRELAPLATSTLGGKLWNSVVKQSGFGATEGATALAEFIAIIDNQVLPLLKPTFGGSFSIQEGETLKASFARAGATADEIMAQLDAFIAQKERDITTTQSQINAAKTISTQAEFDALPKGAYYIQPDGETYRK